ncbi:MAG: hypothetical protein IPG28_12505 [Betaproteobacteria bacterium]|nr:hypothetical protein [Betaproteobacteria bacterium]
MSERTAQAHTRAVRPRKVAVSKVSNARDALAEWGRGMETYCLTFGQFSLMDAIEAILERTGPADVAIATWTAGSADLSRSAESLRNGNIRSLRFVVDCSFGQRQPGYLAQVRELFGDEAIRSTRTHAKYAVVMNDEWSVAVRTSMNLNENPRLESIEVSDDPELAGFLLRVTDEIFAEESAGDFRTKSRPNLPGIPGIEPARSVSMSRDGVRVGA